MESHKKDKNLKLINFLRGVMKKAMEKTIKINLEGGGVTTKKGL